jgi:hypothetical protein
MTEKRQKSASRAPINEAGPPHPRPKLLSPFRQHPNPLISKQIKINQDNSRIFKAERGRPLRRVSTGKKASVPNFFLIGLHTLLPRSLLHRALLEPVFSSFDFRSFLAEPLLNEATRSVTHLVLAPDRKCLFIKSFPSFLRLSCDRLSAPIPLQRDQKTFSTGPCSFSFKSFGFVVACHQAPNVQPVFDSRHGRIACKILSPAVPLLVG